MKRIPGEQSVGEPQEITDPTATMKERIRESLGNAETRKKVEDDYIYTFQQIGLSKKESEDLCTNVLSKLLSEKDLPEIEQEVLGVFQGINVGVGGAERNIIDVLHEKLKDRARIIASQVGPHLKGVDGKTIDYGTGDGQVAQNLHDNIGLDVEGVDIRTYKSPNVTIPVALFDGKHVDVSDGKYEAGLLTNVLHHEKDNESILKELDRIVSNRLVVLETVPVGENDEEMGKDKDRTFMNDYLYNRLFHNANVPVPGAFETPKDWVKRFEQHGWKLTHEEDLGFDQPTIKDRHYLLVFEK
jgi:ubiquinone/menaquinone biosynthesis C-methylase UbiE